MRFAIIFSLMMLLAGCVFMEQRKLSHIHETDRQLVSGCASLGVLSEISDAGNPFAFYAERRMLVNIKQRADQLGATHIVWLHKNAQSAAAEAFRCPSQ